MFIPWPLFFGKCWLVQRRLLTNNFLRSSQREEVNLQSCSVPNSRNNGRVSIARGQETCRISWRKPGTRKRGNDPLPTSYKPFLVMLWRTCGKRVVTEISSIAIVDFSRPFKTNKELIVLSLALQRLAQVQPSQVQQPANRFSSRPIKKHQSQPRNPLRSL